MSDGIITDKTVKVNKYDFPATQYWQGMTSNMRKHTKAEVTYYNQDLEFIANGKVNLRKFFPEAIFTVNNVEDKELRELKGSLNRIALANHSTFFTTTGKLHKISAILYSPWLETISKPGATATQIIHAMKDCKVNNLESARTVSAQFKNTGETVLRETQANKAKTPKEQDTSHRNKTEKLYAKYPELFQAYKEWINNWDVEEVKEEVNSK